MVTKEFLSNIAGSAVTIRSNKDIFIEYPTSLHRKWLSFGQTLHNAGQPKMISCF
jgi:hypothetical protein